MAAPLWAFFLYFAITFGALTLVPTFDEPRSLRGAIIGGLFFGVVGTIWVAFFRRGDRKAMGGKRLADPVAVERALRTGHTPADTSQDRALLALIERRRAQWRWGSHIVPWLFGGVAALCLVAAVVTMDMSWLVLGALYLGLVAFLRVWTTRSLARLDGLESSLRSRSQP